MLEGISKEDKMTLSEIVSVTENINKIYDHFFLYEGFDDCTEKFNEEFDELKRTLEIEKNLYNRLNLTPERSALISEYFFEKMELDATVENNVLLIIKKFFDSEKLWLYRIYNRLCANSLKDVGVYLEDPLEEESIDDDFSDDDPSEEELIDDDLLDDLVVEDLELNNRFKLYDIVDKNLEQAFLYFLGIQTKEIDSPNLMMKSYFIKCKYLLSLISTEIEDTLLERNFEFIDDCYFTFPLFMECTELETEQPIILGLVREACEESVKNMLFNNTDFMNFQNRVTQILGSCYLKAGISSILDQDDLIATMNGLTKGIDNFNKRTNYEFEDSCIVVLDEISNAPCNRSKCKYLSLSPKK